MNLLIGIIYKTTNCVLCDNNNGTARFNAPYNIMNIHVEHIEYTLSEEDTHGGGGS